MAKKQKTKNKQKKSEKRVKWEKNTVGPQIWRGTLKNVENKKRTLQDLKYGHKTTTTKTEIQTKKKT